MEKSFGRVLRTGLLGRARALFHGLGPKGEHPSRKERCEICYGDVRGACILYRRCVFTGERRP